jgi:hypothetical protein
MSHRGGLCRTGEIGGFTRAATLVLLRGVRLWLEFELAYSLAVCTPDDEPIHGTRESKRSRCARCGAHVSVRQVICAVAAAWILAGPSLEPLQAGAPRDPHATLDVILQHSALDSLIEYAMRREAERIWDREGVRLRWHDPNDEVLTATRSVRVQIVDEYARTASSSSETVLGDFRPGLGAARVSLASAARATDEGLQSYRRPLQPFDYPLALGCVLGRAIAHEIGHSLLGGAHAEVGLMQRAFEPSQLVDRQSARFRLTPADAANLFHRLDDGQVTLHVRAPGPEPAAPSEAASDGDSTLAR